MIIAYININKIPSESINTPQINLDYKGWVDDGGHPYAPNDVLRNPKQYKEDYEKITKANLKYPIIVINNLIADGIHRITHAIMNDKKKMKAVYFTTEEAKPFLISKAVRERNAGHEIIELFVSRLIRSRDESGTQ